MTDLSTFWVGDWRVDPSTGSVRRGGLERSLRPRSMDLLVCLAQRPGELLLRQEALEAVWPDVVVKESALNNCVSEIREALDDSGREQRTVRTVVKRGYVLIAPVQRENGATAPEGTLGRGVAPAAHVGNGVPGRAAAKQVHPGVVFAALLLWVLFLGLWPG